MLNPHDFLNGCQVSVEAPRYGVVKAKYVPDTFIAVFRDTQELTVVVPEDALADEWVEEVDKGWKLLSFRTVLPFALTGFLAVVAQALAEEKIAIFALSAYSTDHLLVKEEKVGQAMDKLTALGCIISSLPPRG